LCVVSLLHLRFSLAPEYEFHNAQAGTIYRVVAGRAYKFTPARTGHAPGLFRFLFQPDTDGPRDARMAGAVSAYL
jgi:hypothetical protein